MIALLTKLQEITEMAIVYSPKKSKSLVDRVKEFLRSLKLPTVKRYPDNYLHIMKWRSIIR